MCSVGRVSLRVTLGVGTDGRGGLGWKGGVEVDLVVVVVVVVERSVSSLYFISTRHMCSFQLAHKGNHCDLYIYLVLGSTCICFYFDLLVIEPQG